MLKRSELRNAAKELNASLGLDPEISLDLEIPKLYKELEETITELVKPEVDKFSDETQAVIDVIMAGEGLIAEKETDSAESETEKEEPEKPKATPTKAKPKAKSKAEEEKKLPSLMSVMDELIEHGGPWEDIIAELRKAVEERGLVTPPTVGTIRAHYRYRMRQNPQYFGKRKLMDDGIA